MRYFLYFIIGIVFWGAALPANAKITVALIMPQTDTYAQQGAEITTGVEHAVEEINQNGGLLKQKISLLKIDDQCSDSVAVSTAQMLTVLPNKKVFLVIGPYCNNSFDTAADIYAKAKIFQIVPLPVNYEYAKTVHKGLIKMLGFTDQKAVDFYKFYSSRFSDKPLAVVRNLKNKESLSDATAVEKEFKKHRQQKMLAFYDYQMTDKNYDELAEKIIEDGFNSALLLGSAANIRKIAYALKDKKSDFVVITDKHKTNAKFFDKLEDYANGIYFLELGGKVSDPEFTQTLVKLRLKGFEAEGLPLYGYSAVKLWQQLVEQAKSFEYDKLSAAANNKTVRTEIGNKTFINGAPKESEKYEIYFYKDGIFIKLRQRK